MADHMRDEDQTQVPAGKPSQAEGSRGESEEGSDSNETASPGGKPSQAEGDRETIEEKLGER